MEADLRSIDKLRRGDEAGLKELMSRHRESVYRFIYRYVLNDADAAELTEETFYRVYKYADRYRTKAKVVTWIFSIAGNLCRDLLRKNRKHLGDVSLSLKQSGDGDRELGDSIVSDSDLPDEQVIARERMERMESAIYRLPHKLKFPFIFCVLENNTYDACAEILGKSRKTVEMRIYHARKLLQEELADLSGQF